MAILIAKKANAVLLGFFSILMPIETDTSSRPGPRALTCKVWEPTSTSSGSVTNRDTTPFVPIDPRPSSIGVENIKIVNIVPGTKPLSSIATLELRNTRNIPSGLTCTDCPSGDFVPTRIFTLLGSFMTNWPLSCDVSTATNSPRMRAVVSPSTSLVGIPSTSNTGLLESVGVVVVVVVVVVVDVEVVDDVLVELGAAATALCGIGVVELGAAATVLCGIGVVELGAAATVLCGTVVVALGAAATTLCGTVVVTTGTVVEPLLPDDGRVVVVAGAAITATDCDAAAAESVSLPG